MKSAVAAPRQTPVAKWLARGGFLFRKFVTGHQVAGEPHLDALAAAHFLEVLARTTNYLEYGSGGSTVLAWQAAKVVVTVDNDRRFLRNVQRTLSTLPTQPALFRLIHVDTGVSKRWGFPLFKSLSPARIRRWQRYAAAPWVFLDAHAIQPDTILVDGRFRVACVLESLLRLHDGSACELLVDDYVDRHDYAVVEAFADRVATHGQMVVLRKKADFDRAECLRVLPHFQRDWR